MGLLGWFSKHVIDPVGHTLESGWHGVGRFADHVGHDLKDWSLDAGHWLAKRWKPLAAGLIAGVVFAAVFVFCPEFGPAIIAWAMPALVAGLASGAAGQASRDLFHHETPGADLIVPALLSAAMAVGGMGLGRVLLGTATVAARPALASVVTNLTGARATGTAVADEGMGVIEAGLDKLRKEPLFILQKVSPGPADYLHIIKGDGDGPSQPSSKLPGPPPPASPGFVNALDGGESDAQKAQTVEAR